MNDFVAEYAAGHLILRPLQREDQVLGGLERGVALGFDAVCTGPAARLIRTEHDVGCIGPSTSPGSVLRAGRTQS